MTTTEKPIVLFTSPIHDAAMQAIAEHAQIRVASATDASTLIEAGRDASAIVVRAWLPEDYFDHTPQLLAAVRQGAGIDMVPYDNACKNGVAIANVPGVNAQSVAEYAVGQMLGLGHKLSQTDRTARQVGWAPSRELAWNKVELHEKTVGVVGVGDVGQAVARIAHWGLGMKVLGYRPSGLAPNSWTHMVDLPTLFATADFIVLACPLNDQTHHLVNASLLAQMKASAFLVNVARGPVVDEAALVQALQDQQFAGAALDVFETQPLAQDSPLWDLDNVVIGNHTAGMTAESVARMGAGVAKQIIQVLQGQLPENLCNPQAKEAILTRFTRMTPGF